MRTTNPLWRSQEDNVAEVEDDFAELSIGIGAIQNYSRLSYTMWNALAEFIDNSTQSRTNYGSIVEDVFAHEGTTLIVEIDYSPIKREITITDNSIGMDRDTLVNALRIAKPTKDSKGRSRYGMGMKTAACWIGSRWRVETCEWDSGIEWCADVDVAAIEDNDGKIPITRKDVSKDAHYTRITITGLHRNIQKRTDENIRNYLGSMYRYDIADGKLKIVYRGDEIKLPDELNFDTDPEGHPMKMEIPPNTKIGGKLITGWVGVLRKGGRKFGGFSLFQNRRQIQGFPNAFKPRSIFGGVDEEGANNLVAQRLTGVIELDPKFNVSHTKDAILFDGDEEEDFEDFLQKFTDDYRKYAQKRRDPTRQPWAREKFRDIVDSLSKEFESNEIKDAINTSVLPPLETIISNNQKQAEALTEEDKATTIEVSPQLKVIVSIRETSEYEPHAILVAGAEPGTMHVIINRLHPYYPSLESADAVEECIRQYIYDAIAEYQVSKMTAKVDARSVNRYKDNLLRAAILSKENAATAVQDGKVEITVPTAGS